MTRGKTPDGYGSVLTRKQWMRVLDFAAYVGAKLLISVSNCVGGHPHGGLLELSGTPQGYTAADYTWDQDILYKWLRANYPNGLLVGPFATGDPAAAGTQIPLDVFSYHYYNGKGLTISGTCGIPELPPALQPRGTVLLGPGSCTFLVL